MNESLKLIQEIEQELNFVISQKNKLAKQNLALQLDREKLLEERIKHTNQINELKNEIKSLKLALGMADNSSKEQAKKRIEAILREINVCIALINKK